jgi:hypothetical protein
MRAVFMTPSGKVERELTPTELQEWAADGDIRARKEIGKDKISKAQNDKERLDAIEEFLDLK